MFSKDPERFIDEFKTIVITFELTWEDLHILFILS
jgi:hypothetical protein